MADIPLIISLLVTQISPSVIIIVDGRWKIPLSQWTFQLSSTREARGLSCIDRTQPQWFPQRSPASFLDEWPLTFPGCFKQPIRCQGWGNTSKLGNHLLSACIQRSREGRHRTYPTINFLSVSTAGNVWLSCQLCGAPYHDLCRYVNEH